MPKELSTLLKPKCIVTVGASEKYGAGSTAIRNLFNLGFKGRILPVNPKYSEIFGLTCYRALSDIPAEQPVESVAIVLGSGQVLPVLEQATQRGVRGAWAFASGFAEFGHEGARLQERLKALCVAHQIGFCGPNSVGCLNLHEQVGTFSTPLSPTLKKGSVGVVAQSGAMILALMNSNRNVGFSTLISSGNEAVIDTVDYLNYLIDDAHYLVKRSFLIIPLTHKDVFSMLPPKKKGGFIN